MLKITQKGDKYIVTRDCSWGEVVLFESTSRSQAELLYRYYEEL